MKVSPGSYHPKSSCGYCGGKKSSKSYGFLAYSVTLQEYQDLIDRGFRRSGTYIYKPDLRGACCPQYTIRLPVDQFSPTKEHRQCINRFCRRVNPTHDGQGSNVKTKGKKNHFDLLETVQNAENEKFKTVIEPASFSSEKHKLYQKYQMSVHGDDEDDCDEEQFTRFLCENPFSDEDVGNNRGAVHQLYYYEGKLIAFGVLDLLPHCVSSVYFVWDPEWAKFSMGKVASLQEISLAKSLKIPYYYMGFYILSCPKMSYKGQYHPSELLDPQFNSSKEPWLPLEKFKKVYEETGKEYITFVQDEDTDTDYKGINSDLFKARVPGVLRPNQLKPGTHRYVRFSLPVMEGHNMVVPIEALAPESLRVAEMLIAEFVAAVGTDLAKDSVIQV